MTDQRSKGSKGGNGEPDLDEVLRELGRDVLDEPVPERLLRILRRGRANAQDLADGDGAVSPPGGEGCPGDEKPPAPDDGDREV